MNRHCFCHARNACGNRSLKADILPPVRGEKRAAFTLPKMAVAAAAERVHSAKTNHAVTGDAPAVENDPVEIAGANGAVTSATCRAASGHAAAAKRRNIAGYPAIVTKAVVQTAPLTPDATAGTHAVAAAVCRN